MERFSAILIIVYFIVGCATPNSIKDITPKLTNSYSASYQEVWDAIPSVLHYRWFVITEENKEKSYILAARYPGPGTWGQSIAIFVDPKPTEIGEIEVSVVCRPMLMPDFSSFQWDSDFLDRLGDKLKEGKPEQGNPP